MRLHVQHISVLKVPVKGLLGTFDVKLSDLVRSTNVAGVTVSGNDIIFDTEKLLPPPHIRGQLTTVRVKVPDIEVIYGNAPNDPTQLAQWHNFLRFRNGALNFGKLTMHHADLTMIDAANEPWFDLDLVNYQNQLVNGNTRMTAQAGVEIYMPSLKEQASRHAGQSVTLRMAEEPKYIAATRRGGRRQRLTELRSSRGLVSALDRAAQGRDRVLEILVHPALDRVAGTDRAQRPAEFRESRPNVSESSQTFEVMCGHALWDGTRCTRALPAFRKGRFASTRDFSAPALAYQKTGQQLPPILKHPSCFAHHSPVIRADCRVLKPGQQTEGQIESRAQSTFPRAEPDFAGE